MSNDKNTSPVLTRRKTHGSSSLKSTLPAEYLSKLNKSLTFNDKVVSLVNSIISDLGPENGRSVSTRGVKKGVLPFTGSTEISLGRFLGKYELSYRTTTDEEGNIKYIFTTKYGDPDDPAEYHELWYDPIEEKQMKELYRYAVSKGLEPRYKYATIGKAFNTAVELHKKLLQEYAREKEIEALYYQLPSRTDSRGGTRKQKRNHKQKTRKQRKTRK